MASERRAMAEGGDIIIEISTNIKINTLPMRTSLIIPRNDFKVDKVLKSLSEFFLRNHWFR